MLHPSVRFQGDVDDGVFGKVVVEVLHESGLIEPVVEFNLEKVFDLRYNYEFRSQLSIM